MSDLTWGHWGPCWPKSIGPLPSCSSIRIVVVASRDNCRYKQFLSIFPWMKLMPTTPTVWISDWEWVEVCETNVWGSNSFQLSLDFAPRNRTSSKFKHWGDVWEISEHCWHSDVDILAPIAAALTCELPVVRLRETSRGRGLLEYKCGVKITSEDVLPIACKQRQRQVNLTRW